MFKVFFNLVAMADRILYGIEIFERGHQKILPVKFGEIPPSS